MTARLTLAAALILGALAGTGIKAGAQDVWLQKAHDARRTGQSGSFGMQSVDSAASWQYTAEAAFELNIGATVDTDGVYFGSWGLLRSDTSGLDVRFWNKSDGKLYGLDRETGAERWAPNPLDLVARCYDRAGRERTSTYLLGADSHEPCRSGRRRTRPLGERRAFSSALPQPHARRGHASIRRIACAQWGPGFRRGRRHAACLEPRRDRAIVGWVGTRFVSRARWYT